MTTRAALSSALLVAGTAVLLSALVPGTLAAQAEIRPDGTCTVSGLILSGIATDEMFVVYPEHDVALSELDMRGQGWVRFRHPFDLECVDGSVVFTITFRDGSGFYSLSDPIVSEDSDGQPAIMFFRTRSDSPLVPSVVSVATVLRLTPGVDGWSGALLEVMPSAAKTLTLFVVRRGEAYAALFPLR